MATIYYWSMNATNYGHLSMELDDGTYISHWPEGGARKACASPTQSCPAPNLQSDIREQGGREPETLTLPSGMIDVNEMKRYWNSVVADGANYHVLFSNCAQMVKTVLEKGGIGKYDLIRDAFPLSNGHIMPVEVFTWAQRCKAEYENPTNPLVRTMFSVVMRPTGLPFFRGVNPFF